MWLKCPRQFYFRYVLGRKEIPKIALLEGSAHHEALQGNNLYKKKRGKDLKPSVITDSFLETLRSKVKKEGRVEWEGENENTLFRRAKVWHVDYARNFAPKIRPNLIEEEFEKPIDEGLNLKCVVDLTYSKRCSDYKTTSPYGFATKKKNIDSDLQLSFYSWATGLEDVENICFIKKPNPEVAPIRSRRSKKGIIWAFRLFKIR